MFQLDYNLPLLFLHRRQEFLHQYALDTEDKFLAWDVLFNPRIAQFPKSEIFEVVDDGLEFQHLLLKQVSLSAEYSLCILKNAYIFVGT